MSTAEPNRIPFRPVYDQVVVRREDPPKKIGLIHVPETVQARMLDEATCGVVVAIGPGRYASKRIPHKPVTTADGGLHVCARCGDLAPRDEDLCPKLFESTTEREPVDVRVGDRVWFHPKAGTKAKIGDVEYIVAWDDEMMAVEDRT